MDTIDILAQVRMNMVLVSLTLRIQSDRDTSIDGDKRKKIMDLQREVKQSFEDCSIKFGRRRAIPVVMFEKLLGQAGKSLGELKAMLQPLNETQAAGFGVAIEYEPVPDPAAFGMLSERLAGALGSAVNKRTVDNFEDGFDNAFRCYHSRLGFFLDRATSYGLYIANPTGKRAILRNSVLTDLTTIRELVSASNLAGLIAAGEACRALEGLDGVNIEALRKPEPAVREAAMATVRRAFEITRNYFGVDGDEEVADDGE